MPGELVLPADTLARPGETVEVAVELGKAVALEAGLGFAIREGGLTVGAGTVLSAPAEIVRPSAPAEVA